MNPRVTFEFDGFRDPEEAMTFIHILEAHIDSMFSQGTVH